MIPTDRYGNREFHIQSLLRSCCVSLSRYSFLCLYPGTLKNREWLLHYLQSLTDEVDIGYWYPIRSFGDLDPPNSMRNWKCRGHLQANRGLGIPIYPFSHEPDLFPFHILARKYPIFYLIRIGWTLSLLWLWSYFKWRQ